MVKLVYVELKSKKMKYVRRNCTGKGNDWNFDDKQQKHTQSSQLRKLVMFTSKHTI